MKIRSNIPPASPDCLDNLNHGDVFRLHNNSLESVAEGSNPAFIRGFAPSADAHCPVTNLRDGHQSSMLLRTQVYKVNATLVIDP